MSAGARGPGRRAPRHPLTHHPAPFSAPAPAGFADGYYGNTLWLTQDGAYGSGQTCSGNGATVVFGNTIYSPTGAITECGTTLAKWQAAGGDPGTTAAPYPADSVILALARSILNVPGGEQ